MSIRVQNRTHIIQTMKIPILYLLILTVSVSFAQNSNRIFKKTQETENGLEIIVNDGRYTITFITEKIVETTFIPLNDTLQKESHAVILKAKEVAIVSVIGKNKSEFFSDGISVEVKHKPFQIIYKYNSKVITSEKKGYFKSKHEPMDLVKGNIVAEETEKIEFNLSPDEVLYGAGARALGMNRRGNRLPLYNRAHYGYETHSALMNFTMPLIISSKKYMLHFDNAAIGYLDLDSKKDNSLTYETISGRKTYQVIVGKSWMDLVSNYTNLTGKQPLPPRWALGNFSSRFGYHSQKETAATIEKFKEEKIPVDAVILDLYWFGKELKGTMGNLEVYKDSFPDMKGMIARLKDKGVKTVLITEPFIVSNSKKWNEAVAKDVLAKDSVGNPAKYDFYFGNTGIVDIYKEEGKRWFWNVYKELLDLGVKGLWGDLGEPEVHPTWVQHAAGSADEIHNIYGHDWARLIFEGYQKEVPNERPFILMRAGYSGSQRFGMIPWSGDVSRTWGGLQSQPEIALQMGMQGLGYMHSDLGGFAGANLDDNLYIRWLQYGVFQPIYRPHAQEDVPSEPVFRSKKAMRLAKKAIELRYQLLPYNYNLAFINNQKGTPLMRPIFFEEDAEKLMTNASTYLWGKDFLITPILKDSVKVKEIYFPKTANWFNFYTDNKIEGGQTKSVAVAEARIPTYVRAGAFIPMTKLVQTTDDYDGNSLEIHYYFDASVKKSERTMYNDNGLLSNAFEKNEYEILGFEAAVTKRYLEIGFEAEFGDDWNPSEKEIILIIHNINWNPKEIKVNGKRKQISSENKKLTIPFKWDIHKELKIKITLK
jgi:oligosaccharide 4-alpha-D-glucosyltransferase